MKTQWIYQFLFLVTLVCASAKASSSIDTLFRFSSEFPVSSTIVTQIEPASEGRFYALGRFGILGTQVDTVLRFNGDGSWDTDFALGSLGGSSPTDVAVIPDGSGRVLISGVFTTVQGFPVNGIARFLADGRVDRTFRSASLSGIWGIRFANNGKFYAYGSFASSVNEVYYQKLARLNSDGSIDPTFFVNFSQDRGLALFATVQKDGKVIVLGNFTAIDGFSVPGIARLRDNGSLDLTYRPPRLEVIDSNAIPRGRIELQDDGRLLVGIALRINSRKYDLIRLNTDGSLDESFAQPTLSRDYTTNQDHLIANLCLTKAGQIVIGGSFTHISDQAQHSIALLDTSGHHVGCFAPEFSGPFDVSHGRSFATWISRLPNGSILAAGKLLQEGVIRFLDAGSRSPIFSSIHFDKGYFAGTLNTFPGQTNLIYVSTNLKDWFLSFTNIATSCMEQFVDPEPSTSRIKFYRAVSPQ